MDFKAFRSIRPRPQRVYHYVHDACEAVERYRPGEHHPVHIDNFFNDGQYKIIRKLGYSLSSTVWLVRDLK